MSSQSAATLRSRYLEQAASDLEENRRLQQELTERIEMLKREEELLVDILNLTQRLPEHSDGQPLPGQAPDGPALPQARTRAEAAIPSEGAAAATRAPTQSANGASKDDAKGKSRHPLLGDLLMELLDGHEEPRLAKEVRDELLERHPDRQPTPQVVRNTLESLVAKGRIRRHKQKRSVMYTLVGKAPKNAAVAASASQV